MKKKSVLSLTLCLALLLGLLSACGGRPEISQSPTPAPTPGASPSPDPVEESAAELDEVSLLEYERALGYGFLPDGLEDDDPDSRIVTWSEFCDMLGRLVVRVNEGALPDWEEMTAEAPDTPMKRDGAMIALLFAAQTLGVDDANSDYWFMSDDYDWGAKES